MPDHIEQLLEVSKTLSDADAAATQNFVFKSCDLARRAWKELQAVVAEMLEEREGAAK